ncbi:MAG: PIN domain-containing protein, partial [Bacteroidota bacterium]
VIKVDGLTGDLRVIPTTKKTAKIYAEIKYKLRKKGRPIPENDIWIAATAMQFDLTLITKDKHFKEIEGLKLELWPVEN